MSIILRMCVTQQVPDTIRTKPTITAITTKHLSSTMLLFMSPVVHPPAEIVLEVVDGVDDRGVAPEGGEQMRCVPLMRLLHAVEVEVQHVDLLQALQPFDHGERVPHVLALGVLLVRAPSAPHQVVADVPHLDTTTTHLSLVVVRTLTTHLSTYEQQPLTCLLRTTTTHLSTSYNNHSFVRTTTTHLSTSYNNHSLVDVYYVQQPLTCLLRTTTTHLSYVQRPLICRVRTTTTHLSTSYNNHSLVDVYYVQQPLICRVRTTTTHLSTSYNNHSLVDVYYVQRPLICRVCTTTTHLSFIVE